MLRVVKLGGSLHCVPELANSLKALVEDWGNVVLVPGGGPFADTIRWVQAQSGISDAAAHRMALLAMEQYGLMLCDMEPRLIPLALPISDSYRRRVWRLLYPDSQSGCRYPT